MKLVVGLGNPGLKYAFTRHNMGFLTIYRLMSKFNIDKLECEKFNGLYHKFKIHNEDVIIAKPMTFMNNSGEFIRDISNFYKIEPKDIIVLYDELAIDFGRIKIMQSGSSAGHNGIKSIISCLGTENFIRVRVGIGPVPKPIRQIDFVLMKYTESEFNYVKENTDKAALAVMCIIEKDIYQAMNIYNVK